MSNVINFPSPPLWSEDHNPLVVKKVIVDGSNIESFIGWVNGLIEMGYENQIPDTNELRRDVEEYGFVYLNYG